MVGSAWLRFREDRNRLRLTADGLAEFNERHPKKPSDFPGRLESIFFVKTNCPIQRVGCVDSDCLTSRLAEFVFGCFKERSAQARSVSFGVDRHTSKVSFAALQNLVSDGANDFSGCWSPQRPTYLIGDGEKFPGSRRYPRTPQEYSSRDRERKLSEDIQGSQRNPQR